MEPVGDASEERPVLRYRNRAWTEADLAFIRTTIAQHGSLTRPALSRLFCEAWGWRQKNGELSEYACRDLLLRLEEWGHVELPPTRRTRASEGTAARSRRHQHLPVVPWDLIALVEEKIEPDDLEALVVRPISAQERLGWRIYMDRHHYLGERPIVGEHLLYAAFADGKLCALLAWASAAFRVPARERHIGWDERAKRERLHFVANNVRFLVLPGARVKNLASMVLARNLRRLCADWQAAWGHPVYLAETFVDRARFRGTCYQAANWQWVGETAGRTKRGNTYLHGSSRKAVFVYPLRRNACRHLRGEAP